MTIEDYVHRLGRTGRAGAKGEAYTFFTDDENKMARKLIEVLKFQFYTSPDGIQMFDEIDFSKYNIFPIFWLKLYRFGT